MVPAAIGLIIVLTALFSLLGVLLKEKARPTWIIKYLHLYRILIYWYNKTWIKYNPNSPQAETDRRG